MRRSTRSNMIGRYINVRSVLCLAVFFWFLQVFRLYSIRRNAPPSNSDTQSTFPENQTLESPSSAYVFYATNDDYACSALVNIHRLRTIFDTRSRIIALSTSSVSESFLTAFRARNVTVINHEAPPLADGSVPYYRDVLLKLVSFNLRHFEPSLRRIIVLDADQLILKPLDDLFVLPPVDVAAPRAYWIGKETASSTFLLVNLSDRLWRRIELAMKEIRKDVYDMDLINEVLGWEMMLLPGHYAAINSHWETNGLPSWFRDDDEEAPAIAAAGNSTEAEAEEKAVRKGKLYRAYDQASVLHFFALGKPWSYTLDEVRRNRPEAHPLFVEQFSTWRTTAKEVCPGEWNGSFIEKV